MHPYTPHHQNMSYEDLRLLRFLGSYCTCVPLARKAAYQAYIPRKPFMLVHFNSHLSLRNASTSLEHVHPGCGVIRPKFGPTTESYSLSYHCMRKSPTTNCGQGGLELTTSHSWERVQGMP